MEDVPNSLSRTLRMPTASARVTPVDSGGSRSSSNGAATKLGSTPGELAARAQLPFGLTHDMAAWFIVSAEQTGKKIVAEAYGAFQATTDKAMAVNDPSRSGVRFLVRGHGVAIYQHVPVQREQTSRTRSLWNRLCRRRSNESETPRTAIPAKLPEHQNAEMSRHRVQTTLLKIAAAIESRAKAAMALDHSPVYNVARRAELFRQFAECSTCAAEPTGGKLHACRKCYAAVCSECSQIWRRGHKDYRLCIGCWHEAQATETTGSGRGTARFA